MTPSHTRTWLAAIAAGSLAFSAAAQGVSPGNTQPGVVAPDAAAIAKAKADSVRHPYTEADVYFMQGMIGHHAQAIVMAKWAPTHGASASILTLSARIINSQNDEIVTMQQWLIDRQLPVPAADANGMKMNMGGTEHTMLMPGMLTPEQMKALDAARGTAFDRLFLSDMIQHHTGAVQMVAQLMGTTGAAEDELVFKFANDVQVDQTTEIARMNKMLAALPPAAPTPAP